MDKLTNYRNWMKGLLRELADLSNGSRATGAETLCVFDEERGQYLLITTGWVGKRRQRGTTVYLRLLDGKIWLEEDWTDIGVAEQLVKAGVPRTDIVLGFQPPSMRHLTEFAAV